MVVVVQNKTFCECSPCSVAQTASTSQVDDFMYILLYAYPSSSTARTIKTGRNASSACRLLIQLPLMPSISSTKGPAQQAEAVKPASSPAKSTPLFLPVFGLLAIECSSCIFLGIDCFIVYIFFLLTRLRTTTLFCYTNKV